MQIKDALDCNVVASLMKIPQVWYSAASGAEGHHQDGQDLSSLHETQKTWTCDAGQVNSAWS
jgi:hypothetical protein